MRKTVLIFITSLAALAACNRTPLEERRTDEILFFTHESGAPVSVVTKATAVTTSTLENGGFYAAATTGSAGSESSAWTSHQFTGSGTPGSMTFSGADGGKFWPASNPNYHFYASNVALSFAAAGTTVSADSGTDVVCAYLASPTYKTVNTLTFQHVFARIGEFTVTAEAGYTVSAVSVRIVPKTGGTYNLRTGSGVTDGSAGWSALTTGFSTELANAVPGTKSNDVWLVPGTYGLLVSWTAAKGGYTNTFTDVEVDVAVTAGNVSSYMCTLGGTAAAVQFQASVTPWNVLSPETIEVPFS